MSWFDDHVQGAVGAEPRPGRKAYAVGVGAVAVVTVLVLTAIALRWHRAEPVTAAQPTPPAAVVEAAEEVLLSRLGIVHTSPVS
jgi:hypothetical protein